MSQPVWLLMKHEEIVASVRAVTKKEAARIFRRHGLRGTHVIPSEERPRRAKEGKPRRRRS